MLKQVRADGLFMLFRPSQMLTFRYRRRIRLARTANVLSFPNRSINYPGRRYFSIARSVCFANGGLKRGKFH